MVMELQVDRELLEEIRRKTAEDQEMQEVILKLQKGVLFIYLFPHTRMQP
jgi:hypothetical protein